MTVLMLLGYVAVDGGVCGLFRLLWGYFKKGVLKVGKTLGLLLVKSGCTNLVPESFALGMAAKMMEGRMDSMEKKNDRGVGRSVARDWGSLLQVSTFGFIREGCGYLVREN